VLGNIPFDQHVAGRRNKDPDIRLLGHLRAAAHLLREAGRVIVNGFVL
jgi:hypothetical protein